MSTSLEEVDMPRTTYGTGPLPMPELVLEGPSTLQAQPEDPVTSTSHPSPPPITPRQTPVLDTTQRRDRDSDSEFSLTPSTKQLSSWISNFLGR